MILRMLSSMPKWEEAMRIKADPAADTWFVATGDVIGDLKTQGNTLSFWRADSQEDIDDAVVALSLTRQKIQKLLICILDEKILTDKLGIEVVESPGAVQAIKSDEILQKHRDLVDLEFWKIGFLSQYMIEEMSKEGTHKEFTKPQIISLLNRYKDEGKVDVEKVSGSLIKDLDWE